MYRLDLSREERRAYLRGLSVSHPMRVRVQLLTNEEKVISTLTAGKSEMLSGTVVVDVNARTSRMANLEILDPRHRLQLDSDSPSEAALWANDFVRIWRGDWIHELGGYVDAPVFTGPMTYFQREGDHVRLEGLGKESLLQDPAFIWGALNFNKGARMTRALKEIARSQGERNFGIPNLKARLDGKLSVPRRSEAWKRMMRLAKDLNRQLFYDGFGTLRLRHYPDDSAFTFRDREGTVLSDPSLVFDYTKLHNVVEVKGRKKGIRHVAWPDRKHPLHPSKLARHGEQLVLLDSQQHQHIRSNAQARRVANRRLRNYLRFAIDAKFDAVVVPTLEESDASKLVTERVNIDFSMRQFTIPLVAEPMPIGFLRRIRVKKRSF